MGEFGQVTTLIGPVRTRMRSGRHACGVTLERITSVSAAERALPRVRPCATTNQPAHTDRDRLLPATPRRGNERGHLGDTDPAGIDRAGQPNAAHSCLPGRRAARQARPPMAVR
jgi:hypothetical protein